MTGWPTWRGWWGFGKLRTWSSQASHSMWSTETDNYDCINAFTGIINRYQANDTYIHVIILMGDMWGACRGHCSVCQLWLWFSLTEGHVWSRSRLLYLHWTQLWLQHKLVAGYDDGVSTIQLRYTFVWNHTDVIQIYSYWWIECDDATTPGILILLWVDFCCVSECN